MESYLRVVGQAVLVFPVAAALIALPFLIHHYRKYGGMTFARFSSAIPLCSTPCAPTSWSFSPCRTGRPWPR